MQQSNRSETDQALGINDAQQKELMGLLDFLKEGETFIENDLINLLISQGAGLGHAKYPVKTLKYVKSKYPKIEYAGSWYDIRSKVEERLSPKNNNTLPPQPQSTQSSQIKRIATNSQFPKIILTSDLLIWSIPNLCSTYMGLMNYVKKYKSEQLPSKSQQVQNQRNELCKKLIEESYEKNSFYKVLLEKEQITELNFLKMPLLLIGWYFQKWMEILIYYENKEKVFKEKFLQLVGQGESDNSQTQQVKKLKNLLDLTKLERIQIQNRVKQAEKYLQDIQTVQSLDPEVYKNRLILTQYKPALSPTNKYLFRYGKRLRFIQILKNRAKKAQKHIKQRKDSIFQLIDKEKFYIDNLAEYIDYIKTPIEQLKILSDQELKLLFCNIDQIKKFHEELYRILNARYQKHHKYQTYGDIIKSMIPFFLLYTDYIYQAQAAQNYMAKLSKQNQPIKEICDKYFIEKHKVASNELSQPTFKIARYEMLFDEILKKTHPATLDFKYFTQTKNLFKSKLTQVNNTVDKIVRRNKLNQLDQEFGTPEQPVFTKEKCEYLDEFKVLMVYQEKQLNVILFIFTDVIIIAEENTRKKLKYMKIDEKFYVRRQEDSKVYKNVIKIHSKEGYVTVSAGNDQKDLKKANQMFTLLKKIQKDTEYNELIYVQVLGTEEIGSTSFAKYTEYIIEVKFLNLKKLLHLRFSQISNIVKVMQNYYKDSLGITEDETLKKTWFNNHKSKTIEDRKRTIEQILQKLFNHEKIKAEPKFLLNFLNLPQNFFQIAKQLSAQKMNSKLLSKESQRQTIQSSQTLSKQIQISPIPNKKMDKSSLEALKITESFLNSPQKLKSSKLSRREMKEAFTLLCATQIKLGRDIYHDLDPKIQAQKEKAEKVQIYIHIMPRDEVQMVRVTQFDTVEDVCNKVSKLLGLRSNRDFRLFHEIGKKELRVLEHEQLILKIFSFPRQTKPSSEKNITSIVNNVTSMVQTMASSLIKVISPQTHPTLIFKKYYFLPFEIEQKQWKKDLTRLRLLAYQVFAQVKDMKYQLNFNEYLKMIALLIYMETDGNIDKEKIDPDIVHRIIPETIFKLKNYSEEEWLKNVEPDLKKYQEEIRKVIEYNQKQVKQSKFKVDETTKTALHFGHRHLASQTVLNRIKHNPIYGSNLFYVQPYKKTYEELKGQSLKIAYNMWLAVKVDSISLLTPSSKEAQFQLKYKDIDKINVYSEAIVFKTDDFTNKEYRFNTYQSFQISQLVKYYKTLNEVMIQLSQDEKLSSQVGKYRKEIQHYRSTYEAHEEFQLNVKVQ